ncbi:MAG: DNA polymerase IV, partial [Erysipelotrichaceae bacterium]|nr:DNA polymerase IV [Erysipelotrichaceae bacterium]
MAKVILHIDLNAFFVRAEEIKDPTLEGKAVAIGRLGRAGIISTCSYEARKYGVHSGMPSYLAKEKCPELLLLSGDHKLYHELSRAFHLHLLTFTDQVEMAGIDEAYVDLTSVIKHQDPMKLL